MLEAHHESALRVPEGGGSLTNAAVVILGQQIDFIELCRSTKTFLWLRLRNNICYASRGWISEPAEFNFER